MTEPEAVAEAAETTEDMTVEVTVIETRVMVLTEEEIGALPILKPGSKLEPGGVYIDLSHPHTAPFKAIEGQVAGTGNRYIARRDVPHDVWNRVVESELPFAEEPFS
jgi:hypothetical protein